MQSFKNLKDLEKFVLKKAESAMRSEAVASVFKHTMSTSVQTEVYNAYQPIEYDRREETDGLSDEDNMHFTSHGKAGKKTLASDFENLTLGNERQSPTPIPYDMPISDSMSGQYISSLIENGNLNVHSTNANSENGWYSITTLDGERGGWTYPRPFAKATAWQLNTTGTMMNRVLKETLEHHINK